MLKTIASTLNGSSLSSNGNIETRCLIACQDGTVRIYSLNQQRIIRILEGHVGWVNSVIVFCNGHACITCGSDRTALVWNLDTYEKTATLIGHNGWVLDADVLETDSASPKFTVVTACYDGSLRKFTIKNPLLQQDKDDVTFQILSPTLTIKSHDGGIKFVDFYDKTASSPKCLTGGYDGKIIKYNLKRINSRESNYQVLTNNTGGYDGKIIEYNRKRINSREFNYQVLTNNIDTRNIKDIGVFCRLSKPYAISADASRNVIQWDLAGGTIKSIDYVFSHKITEIIGIKILDHRYFIGTIFLGVFALFGCAIDEDTIIPDNSFIALAADNKGNLDLDLPLPKFETPTCFDIFINENEYNIITGTKSGQIVLFKLSKAECLVQADRENIYKLILQYAFNISQGSSIVDNNLKGSVIDRKEIDWFTKNGAYV